MMIDDPKVADFLRRPEALICLGPFLARERTVRAAADELGVPIERLNYWVKKFVKSRLLEFVRFEKTQRHRAAVYRSVADEFEIPYYVDSFHDALRALEGLEGSNFARFRQTYARGMERALHGAHIKFFRHDNGRLEASTVADTTSQVGYRSNFQELYLNPDEIEALTCELDAFESKWEGISDRNKPGRVLLHLGLIRNPMSIFEV